jgi:ribonuclease G
VIAFDHFVVIVENSMASELIINATSMEKRVALIENDLISELYIERTADKGIVGNIYKGKVVRVLPGMQAAFVDIGLDRAGFLYVDDICLESSQLEDIMEADESEEQEDEIPEFEHDDEQVKRQGRVPIDELLKEGQEILVQVAKDPIGTKGARLTSYISLPGRFLVLMPTVDHVGISRRVVEEAERKRLKDYVESIRPKSMGFIVRTVAESQSQKRIKADMDFLIRLWKRIKTQADKSRAPLLIHSDLDIIYRAIRDLFTEEVDRLVIDSPEEFKQVRRFLGSFLPRLKHKVELYDANEPIYDAYSIELEINRALGRKVWLKSGGYIIIDQAEALTAIDVNTGRYVGKRNLEDTILRTNLEAAREIAYQLRLRNCGGIIIIDFIDMEKELNREKVFQGFTEALKKDRAKTNILKISDFGLVEMTRKRVRESIVQMLCQPCSYCDGKGYVKSKTTVTYDVYRQLEREAVEIEYKNIVIYTHPDIADILYSDGQETLSSLEKRYKKKITVKSDPNFHIEQFEIFGKK